MDSSSLPLEKKAPIGRRSYSNQFKLEVVECGSREGMRKTGRKYGIGESLVRQWVKNVTRIKQQAERDKDTLKWISSACDEKIYEWYMHCISKGQVITKNLAVTKAKAIYSEIGCTGFNANQWYDHWNKAYRMNHKQIKISNPAVNNSSSDLNSKNASPAKEENRIVANASFNNATSDEESLPNICCEVDVETNSCENLVRKKGEHYLPQFKSRVVDFAKNHTFKETAAKFTVHHSTVSDWCRMLPRDMSVNTNISNPESELVDWLKSRQSITQEELRDKLCDILRTTTTDDKQHRWLMVWASKMTDEHYKKIVKQLDENLPVCDVKTAYPPQVKLEIVKFVEKSSVSVMSKILLISRSNLLSWVKHKDRLHRMVQANRTVDRGQFWMSYDNVLLAWYEEIIQSTGLRPTADNVRAKATEIFLANGKRNFKASYSWYRGWCDRCKIKIRFKYDDHIIDWLLTQFDFNRNVSHSELQTKALSLICQEKPEYKSSAGCVIRFCKRNPDVVASVPPLNHPLPDHMQIKVEKFRTAFVNERSVIGCMDEIPINFGHVGPNKRKPLIRQVGMYKCDAVVVLSALSDGRLLPPLIVCKDDCNSKDSLFRKDCVIDEQTTCHWLEHVWQPNVQSNNILVADCFDGHQGALVSKKLMASNTTYRLIPPGCSCKLQPLNVAIVPLFMRHLDKLIMKEPSVQQRRLNIVSWVTGICEELQTKHEMIRRSFVATGLMTFTDDELENANWVHQADGMLSDVSL